MLRKLCQPYTSPFRTHAIGRKQRSGCDVVPEAPAGVAMPGLLLAVNKGVAAIYDIVYRINDVVYSNKR